MCVCVTYVRKAGMLWGFVWLSFAFLGRHFFRGGPSLINAWASTPSTNQHFSMVKPGLSHDFWDNSLLTQDHVVFSWWSSSARFWKCWRAWDQQARPVLNRWATYGYPTRPRGMLWWTQSPNLEVRHQWNEFGQNLAVKPHKKNVI